MLGTGELTLVRQNTLAANCTIILGSSDETSTAYESAVRRWFSAAFAEESATKDPLAIAMHHGPGVYALLLGSGVSRAASIPTGWEVVGDMIRKVAQVRGQKDAQPTIVIRQEATSDTRARSMAVPPF
jgi:hypothetical protein